MREQQVIEENISLSNQADLISVIIPVYNVAKAYLCRALDSVVHQTYSNLEIIVVDDGSEQQVLDVLQRYEQTDSRIHILFGSHRGVSAARNTGLDYAHGQWVAFADADDEVAPYFLAEALHIAHTVDADIVLGHAQPMYRGSTHSNRTFPVRYTLLNQDDELLQLAQQMQSGYNLRVRTIPRLIGRANFAKIFKRDTIGSLRFDEHVAITEDWLFNRECIDRAHSVVIADRAWYYHYQFATSASHSQISHKWDASIESLMSRNISWEQTPEYSALMLFFATKMLDNIVDSRHSLPALWHGWDSARQVLKRTAALGAYNPNIVNMFELKPWVRVFSGLCRYRFYKLAYGMWAVFVTGKHAIKHEHLFGQKGE